MSTADPGRRTTGRSLARVVSGILLLASVVAGLWQPPLVEAARDACAARGWNPGDLAVVQSRESGLLFAKRGTVEFRAKGAKGEQRLHVELSRPAYFLGWRVTEIREDQPPG
jgi:hypothetical protein